MFEKMIHYVRKIKLKKEVTCKQYQKSFVVKWRCEWGTSRKNKNSPIHIQKEKEFYR